MTEQAQLTEQVQSTRFLPHGPERRARVPIRGTMNDNVLFLRKKHDVFSVIRIRHSEKLELGLRSVLTGVSYGSAYAECRLSLWLTKRQALRRTSMKSPRLTVNGQSRAHKT